MLYVHAAYSCQCSKPHCNQASSSPSPVRCARWPPATVAVFKACGGGLVVSATAHSLLQVATGCPVIVSKQVIPAASNCTFKNSRRLVFCLVSYFEPGLLVSLLVVPALGA